MKFAQFLVLLLFLTVSSLSQAQTPGGVLSNLRWWLKADAGVYVDNKITLATNGQTVQLWDDISAISNDAVQSTLGNRPTYNTAIINGNPALFFDNTSNHFLDASAVSGVGATESFYFFIVFKQLSALTTGGLSDGSGSFIIDRTPENNNLMSFKIVSTDKYGYQRRDDGGGNLGGPTSATAVDANNFKIMDFFRDYGATTEGIYINGKIDISQTGVTPAMTGPLVRIGRHAANANQGFHGYIAEIAIYNKALNATTERLRIESYLAMKYGIPLDQSVVTNYVRSDGTTIFPATTATYTPFITDIAGVGRDNGSGLVQSTSQSQNAGSMVSMMVVSPGTTLADNEFLVWGSNNGDVTTGNTADVDGTTIKRRLVRVWRASETGGDVGNMNVSIDLTNVPGALTATDLRLMVNTSSTFATGTTNYTGSLAGRVFTVSGVNIADGNYFTVGTINTTTTPLPVELVDFKVRYEAPIVLASWKTATELNNDYFTLERSERELSFEAVAKIPGAGNSNVLLSYKATDTNPIEGQSYYRLKQTDFDGTIAYSGLKSIYVPYSKKPISIFPNPNGGQQFTITVPDREAKFEYLEILSQTAGILERTVPELTTQNNYSVSLQHALNAGLYLVRIRYGERFYYLKMMVQ